MSKQKENDTNKGKRDKRNCLNELTGREWVYFLNSVELIEGDPQLMTGDHLNDLCELKWAEQQIPIIDEFYPTSGEESHAHHIRKKHPSPKPPKLMRQLIEFFTKKDGWVLDPFVGAGSTLLACSMVGRQGVGIELSKEYIDLYHEATVDLKLRRQMIIQGDSLQTKEILCNKEYLFDLVLTDPPYGNLLSRKRTGERKKKTGDDSATPFTNEQQDLGNMSYEKFYEALKSVITQSMEFLKVKGYVVVFCKDLQPTVEHPNLIHADVVNTLIQIPNLRFRGYKIWYDKTQKLYPFGYPYAYVSNQLHQYILIFRKEE